MMGEQVNCPSFYFVFLGQMIPCANPKNALAQLKFVYECASRYFQTL